MSKVGCSLLCLETARCRDYDHRQSLVSNCIKVTLSNIDTPGLLPETCAYKRMQRGQGLAWWHPLVSGDPATVRDAGISVLGKAKVNEDQLSMVNLALMLQESIDDDT